MRLRRWRLFMSGGFLKTAQMERYEYPLLVTFASLGAGMMLSANDLMTLYVGIETLSLSSYVLAAFRRDSLKSAEAGLKYFVLGALASGLLLLWLVADLRLLPAARDIRSIAAAPASVGLDLRPRVPDLRPCLQGLGRALPHLDAGRLRGRACAGRGVLLDRAEDRGRGAAGPRDVRDVRTARGQLAADHRDHRGALDADRRVRRAAAEQHQAHPGLLLDLQRRLRPDRHRGGRRQSARQPCWST